MRLLAVIILASLMMLSSLPQHASAEATIHDCPSCAEMMTFAEHQMPAERHQSDEHCADMTTCATMAVLSGSEMVPNEDLLRPRPAWPAPRYGTAVNLSLKLPPPRALS
ncbi:hypothetical protein PhaeoP23_01726 [Phaeobacter piscinae]|uniref:Uncharacterized protein n=1 Tax=Phaeobacter piscinae TaxID=1580596 RepID=A0ABN5DG44_9RHOB|nr:hypothetical protein [Phaeobacter piscinae]ATG35868.1 hypothetical protein PhaeoP36_01726 [Phaeobacter piscinae]AUQ86389.1 hypothetical protein PhaeoP42_01727 [Phaeobacter piscinae]AUR24272.1 hypothetical protein PhaeoP23_01726 [Phaeobacter piscinae]